MAFRNLVTKYHYRSFYVFPSNIQHHIGTCMLYMRIALHLYGIKVPMVSEFVLVLINLTYDCNQNSKDFNEMLDICSFTFRQQQIRTGQARRPSMMPDYVNGSPRIAPRPSPRSYVPRSSNHELEEQGLLQEIPLVYFQVAVLCTMTVVIAGIIIFSPSNHDAVSNSRTMGRGEVTGEGWVKPKYDRALDYPCHIKRYTDAQLSSLEYGSEPQVLSFSDKSASWTNITKWSYDYLWHNYGTWNVKTRIIDARPDSEHELLSLGDMLDSLSQPNGDRRSVKYVHIFLPICLPLLFIRD